MRIVPDHIGFGAWIDRCFDQIAQLSLAAGISVDEAADGAHLTMALQNAIDKRSAQIIPFPVRRRA